MAWTWSAMKHTVFLNGKAAATHLATSPFPHVMGPKLFLLHDLPAQDQEAAPVSEFAAYDFAFTEAEAARDFAEKDNQPLQRARLTARHQSPSGRRANAKCT